MILYKDFTFDSAHFLPNVPEGHKCRQLHGHCYHLRVFVEGPVKKEEGWVIDFAELKTIVESVVKVIDHTFLNNIEDLQNPTSELLSIWLWDNIKPQLPLLSRIELKETPTSGTIYEGISEPDIAGIQ
ncbi:6-carboxytetrahydropterin synthase QueD [Pedobacter sp. P351]|uniref:6-carboxytetrahydropterin synthase QueD n=1 Tax=Pedobacter superstes TaxID=3133441 RepID=UPI0030ACCE7C